MESKSHFQWFLNGNHGTTEVFPTEHVASVWAARKFSMTPLRLIVSEFPCLIQFTIVPLLNWPVALRIFGLEFFPSSVPLLSPEGACCCLA